MENLFLPQLSGQSATPIWDVGGVVRMWLGRRGKKEMIVLVKALVLTKDLGRCTTFLAPSSGNILWDSCLELICLDAGIPTHIQLIGSLYLLALCLHKNIAASNIAMYMM